MIITKNLKVKFTKKYKDLGYNVDLEGFINIKIKHLSKGSDKKILAKCDFCFNEKEISFKDYNHNIKNKNLFSCSSKCGVNKTKITNLEKYGVENTSQYEVFKNKREKKIINLYGVKNVFENEKIKEKIKKTNLEKFGFENPFQNQIIKEKIKKLI